MAFAKVKLLNCNCVKTFHYYTINKGILGRVFISLSGIYIYLGLVFIPLTSTYNSRACCLMDSSCLSCVFVSWKN